MTHEVEAECVYLPFSMPCLSHGENTHHQQLTDLLAIETRGGENCVETGGVRRSMAGEGGGGEPGGSDRVH
jgi:hypothetical protein|eukprot:scaffold3282_cov198-Alexandrium_tamarense.AAC.23